MNGPDPLKQTLLDLHAILGSSIPLVLGGGYGLFLRQDDLQRKGARTLFAAHVMPDNRTTQDIDLILRTEVVVSDAGMRMVRHALDSLEFKPIPGNEYLQFSKAMQTAGEVKIDLMVGPLGDLFDAKTVKKDARRVRPRGFASLHAHPLEEAVGVEEHLSTITLMGKRSDGKDHLAEVFVAQPFTYLLMKLLAFRDRVNDRAKDLARHHALDIYRIVGLITQEEDQLVRDMAAKHRNHPKVLEARAVVADSFSRPDALGVLRLREHPLAKKQAMIEQLIAELTAILPPHPIDAAAP